MENPKETMANLITNRHKRQQHGERPTAFAKKQSARAVAEQP